MTAVHRCLRWAWGSLVTAFGVLTILPLVPKEAGKDAAAGTACPPADDLPRAGACFPLVGAALGAGLLVLDRLFGRLGLLARSAVVLVAAAVVTGGLHLDGLADTCDGLFSRADRTRALDIMRDSRLGALGAVALVSVLLLKLSVLASLDGFGRGLGLLLTPVAGRQAIVLAAAAFPPARPGSGLGQALARRLSPGVVAASLAFSAAALAVATRGVGPSALWPARAFGAAALLGALAVAYGAAALISRRLGGLTGDVYGAVNEVAETVFLLLLGLLPFVRS